MDIEFVLGSKNQIKCYFPPMPCFVIPNLCQSFDCLRFLRYLSQRNRATLGLSRHELALGWNFWFTALPGLVPEEFSGLALLGKFPLLRWRNGTRIHSAQLFLHVASGRTILNPAMEESGHAPLFGFFLGWGREAKQGRFPESGGWEALISESDTSGDLVLHVTYFTL